MRAAALLMGLGLLVACGPVSPQRAAQICEERAQAAQGPTGGVTLGASSDGDRYVTGEIGLSSDYLRGRDPMDVYESCVYSRTGQPPIRPPRLRRIN